MPPTQPQPNPNKDTSHTGGMTIVRLLETSFPVFAPIANLPHVDLVERDNDILRKRAFGTDTGVADAYVVNVVPVQTVATLVAGVEISFIAANNNTGASTLDVNGLGPFPIRKNGPLLALGAQDIEAGEVIKAVFDGTVFQIGGGIPGQWQLSGSDIFYSAGKVGIGGTPVGSKVCQIFGDLEVTGTIDPTRVIIKDTGNNPPDVTINTNVPILNVGAFIRFEETGVQKWVFGYDATTAVASNTSAGDLKIFNDTLADIVTVWKEGTGKMGVNTKDPSGLLSVQSNLGQVPPANASGLGGDEFSYMDGSNISAAIFNDITGGNGGALQLYETSSGDTKVQFVGAPGTKGFINNGGKFGVGTDGPTGVLSVQSALGQTPVTNRSALTGSEFNYMDGVTIVAALYNDITGSNGAVFQLFDNATGVTQVQLDSAPNALSYILQDTHFGGSTTSGFRVSISAPATKDGLLVRAGDTLAFDALKVENFNATLDLFRVRADGFVSVNAGKFEVTSGDIEVTTGNLDVTAGDITVVAGGLTISAGSQIITLGDLDIVAGTIRIGGGGPAAGRVLEATDGLGNSTWSASSPKNFSAIAANSSSRAIVSAFANIASTFVTIPNAQIFTGTKASIRASGHLDSGNTSEIIDMRITVDGSTISAAEGVTVTYSHDDNNQNISWTLDALVALTPGADRIVRIQAQSNPSQTATIETSSVVVVLVQNP